MAKISKSLISSLLLRLPAANFSRASIHKACLHKKTDLKVDSFQTLFIDVFISVYPIFYRTDLSTRTIKTIGGFSLGEGASLQSFQQI
jgi:hypothetical protein